MKFLQFVASAMKRRREERPKIARREFSTKKSGDTTVTSFTDGETSSTGESGDDSLVVVVPMWKAENFLVNGPPSDSDWWEDATSDAKAAEGDEQSITSKKHMEENCSDEVEDYDLKLEQPMKGKQFCNRGFLIWSQSREVWVSQGRDTGAEMEKSPPIPSSFRKELVRCLTDRRHFELSQRISLRDMIDAYQDVWNDESCE